MLDAFKNRFPELADKADKWIPILSAEYHCFYAVDYDSASQCDKSIILALLAHLIWFNTQETDGESISPVSSVSVGSVSTSYVTAQSNDLHNFYSLSKYGQLFIMLTRKNSGALWV